MIKTISITTDVPAERTLQIVLPDDVPLGLADIVLVVAPRRAPVTRTLGDLAQSEFFGMWRDRADIGDSAEFASRLRDAAWRRGT